MSQHFGHSSCFIIYEIEGETATRGEVKSLATPAHHAEGDGQEQEAHAHGHSGLLAALEGCAAMLCGGIGNRAADDLKANGIEVLVTQDTELEPDEAVKRLLAGTLRAGRVHRCCCHGHH
jgi:predicted Fe-Mo cluster-binding NifX family protein